MSSLISLLLILNMVVVFTAPDTKETKIKCGKSKEASFVGCMGATYRAFFGELKGSKNETN